MRREPDRVVDCYCHEHLFVMLTMAAREFPPRRNLADRFPVVLVLDPDITRNGVYRDFWRCRSCGPGSHCSR